MSEKRISITCPNCGRYSHYSLDTTLFSAIHRCPQCSMHLRIYQSGNTIFVSVIQNFTQDNSTNVFPDKFDYVEGSSACGVAKVRLIPFSPKFGKDSTTGNFVD